MIWKTWATSRWETYEMTLRQKALTWLVCAASAWGGVLIVSYFLIAAYGRARGLCG